MILDRCLPFFHYHEVHSIQIEATQEAVYRAVKEVTLSEVPVVRALFWLRWLPAVIVNEPAPIQGQRPILEQLLEAGFFPFVQGSILVKWKRDWRRYRESHHRAGQSRQKI
ncbi:hypothetical protein [Brevibacillus sp. H7]|uniref:hypothetical protein n=1 Tax=Brevibacillus sp. H7 TaxID=3349138 RepID=UPI0037FF0CBD